MARKESLKEFSRNFHKFDELTMQGIKAAWSKHTENAFGFALDRVPVAGVILADSGSFTFAKITPQGIESQIVFAVPYAKMIERGTDRNGKAIRLKEVGELSYYAGGTRVNKRKKGEVGFLRKGIKQDTPALINDIFKAVGRAFNKV